MKKKIIAVLGVMFSLPVLACNINAQDCRGNLNGEIERYTNLLKANPVFMKEGLQEAIAKANEYDRKVKNCTTWQCVNWAAQDYHDYLAMKAYDYSKKKPAAQAPAAPKVNDKWAEQCVYVGKSGVAKYSDGSGAQQVGAIPQYSTYNVSNVNGGQLVGLSATESNGGKFVGWVKKADLQMQDLRNCN